MTNTFDVRADRPYTLPSTLPPPQHLSEGTILTLRLPGHTRTNGQEYFAPAIVLQQHEPDGQIEVIIFDPTAGTHYNYAYQIRDIGTKGQGNEREMYEIRSHIGTILFSPDRFNEMLGLVSSLKRHNEYLESQMALIAREHRELVDDLGSFKPQQADTVAVEAKTQLVEKPKASTKA
jgi:hypothetical protein